MKGLDALNGYGTGNWSAANLKRMANGNAPIIWDKKLKSYWSMELSHEPVPFKNGGTLFVPRTPYEHYTYDPDRKLSKKLLGELGLL